MEPILTEPMFTELPGPLSARVAQCLASFRENASLEVSSWLDQRMAEPAFARQLTWVWSGSEFVANNCIRHAELFRRLVDSGDLFNGYRDSTLRDHCLAAVIEEGEGADREAVLQHQLRVFRRYEMLRIVWRDLARLADMVETTRDMSRLADAVIGVTLDKLHRWGCESWGRPVGATSGAEQTLVVLGMGKLGADELNVSSDIDLIFAYPEAGQTEGANRQLSNQEFFIRIGQKLIQALDNQTVDGQVFRVDMRLRPYGSSGALVLNFDALEEYYQAQGRDWERYAMIKSRIICGDELAARELMEMLRAFTYRRYTDFSAIQSLRDMKAMIRLEVKRRDLGDDIKLGPGGIREIEFIAQAFQLIHGGRDRRFRNPRLQDILVLLDTEHLLPDGGGARLWVAYGLLRNVEHVLQGWADQQTQQLPKGEADRRRVAAMMGFRGWPEFLVALDEQRRVVSDLFAGLAADNTPDATPDNIPSGTLLAWQGSSQAELQVALQSLGFDAPELAAERLVSLRGSHAVRAMQADTRSRLDRLLPGVVVACTRVANSTQTLIRVLALLESVARRSTYLVLLIENTPALQQLVTLCAASPWISQSLSRYPVLLDELLDTRALYAPSDHAQLGNELRQHLMRIPDDDLEALMEALRYFRLANGLRVAACEVTGVLPLMKVSDHLTWLAEVILGEVLTVAWRQLTAKHGLPGFSGNGPPGFLIIGYGKLGGIELAHGSDLDLVFLHEAQGSLMTSGQHSVDNETFFARLGQRIIHILSATTSAGLLYEVDMRLRPSGNSGLLVSSLAAFEKYQREQAWTWEHQALVRARPVAGDAVLGEKFAQVRHDILTRARDMETLKGDVVDMRGKMTEHLGLGAGQQEAGRFHLKQDPGGIVDIEFMVQFAVLAQAHNFPQLTRWSDNVRLLETLSETGFFTGLEHQQLTDAYIAYRSAGHQLQLQEEPGIVATEDFDLHRQAVLAIWEKLFGGASVTRSG